MQASTWTTTNRQCQQFGQLPSTHPSHFNQTTSSNDGSNAPCFFSSLSVDKMAASVGYFTKSSFGTKQVSTQRQDLRTADNQVPTSGHQGYYPNSTENASPLCTPNANMNTVFRQQVMYAQKTPGNPQSSVCFNNYEQQGMHPRSTQNLISHAENVTAQMNNFTSPTTSTVQAGYNTQTPVQSHIYSQQQVMYVQKTPGNPQSSVCLNNYEQQRMQQSVNQNLKSHTENVIIQMNNSTSPTTSTVQAGYNTQTPVQSHIYNQQQVMYVQKTPGNPQSSVCLNNYEQQGMHQSVNQNLKSHAENVIIQMNNSTSPTTSTVQAGYNTQTPVQSHIYNQCSQQKSHALPSYSQAVFAKNGYTGSSQVSSPQNVYTVNDQTNDCLPQTNYRQPGQAVNAHFRNNTNTLPNALTAVPVQRHDSYPNQELTQQPFINPNHNVSSMQLSSSTCSSENSNQLLHLLKRPAPPQTVKNMPTKDHSAKLSASMTSMFCHKMNDVASVNLNAPLTQPSQTNRYDTVAAQASSGTVQTSPCRAQRAIAVVLPLSQENSPDQPPSPTDKTSPDTSSNPCFFGSNIMKDARLSTSEESQQLTSSFNVSPEIASILNSSPSLCQMLKMADVAPKLSSLPLSFAQLVTRAPKKLPISEGCKQKLKKGKTPKEKKPSEEPLSSVPTTEWTLKMLRDKIFEMESENKSDGTLTTTAGESGLFALKTVYREFCKKVKLDTVVLSHVKSQNDLNKYTVLEHKEVYVDKIPYTSTWLNINSQLDDIDEEFGLPYFLKCTLFECDDKNDIDARSEQTQTVQTRTESAKLKEPFTQNDQSDQEVLSADRKSNNINEEITASLQSETQNCDENQCESNEHSSDSSYSFKIEVLCPEEAKAVFEQMDHNSSQKVEPPISEETVPNDQNVPKKQTCSATTLETICCIDKWKEKFLGLASEGKCKCKVVPNQDKEAQSRKTDDNSFSMEIFDLTEDHVTSTSPLGSPGDTQEGSSSNSIIFLSESEDESMKVSEANQTPHWNSNNEQDFTKCTGSGSHKREVTTNNETSCERKEPEEECRAGREEAVVAEEKQESFTSTPVSSRDGGQKHGKKTNMDTSDASLSHPSKKRKIPSNLRSQTLMESLSKCKNAAPVARVELAVFGSRKGKCSPTGSRRGNILVDRTYQVPQRIYVKMNSLTSDTQSTESLSSSSVKRRIHENWRKSFPLPTIKIRKNNKNFAIVGGRSLKRKPVNLKRKVTESDDGLCRKRRRTNNQSKSLTLLHKPKDVEFEQENVLKFNVLPSSFSFEEASQNSDSAMDPTADEITVAEKAKEKKQVLKMPGTWCGDSRNQSPTQSPTSESSSLFQEYQRRHKMKQKCMDE